MPPRAQGGKPVPTQWSRASSMPQAFIQAWVLALAPHFGAALGACPVALLARRLQSLAPLHVVLLLRSQPWSVSTRQGFHRLRAKLLPDAASVTLYAGYPIQLTLLFHCLSNGILCTLWCLQVGNRSTCTALCPVQIARAMCRLKLLPINPS